MRRVDGRALLSLVFEDGWHKLIAVEDEATKDEPESLAAKIWGQLDPGEPVTIDIEGLDEQNQPIRLKFSCRTLLRAEIR